MLFVVSSAGGRLEILSRGGPAQILGFRYFTLYTALDTLIGIVELLVHSNTGSAPAASLVGLIVGNLFSDPCSLTRTRQDILGFSITLLPFNLHALIGHIISNSISSTTSTSSIYDSSTPKTALRYRNYHHQWQEHQ